MLDPTSSLQALLAHLTTAAQGRGLNDAQWATAAGLPKETLSRLRRRTDCDFATLRALAEAAGTDLAVVTPASVSPDGHMPRRVDRDYEARLVALCVSGSVDPEIWRLLGPPFFMAGLAVMLASVTGADRKRLLALAEALHPGITEPVVFQTWLTRSPVRPSRFLPMFREAIRRAA